MIKINLANPKKFQQLRLPIRGVGVKPQRVTSLSRNESDVVACSSSRSGRKVESPSTLQTRFSPTYGLGKGVNLLNVVTAFLIAPVSPHWLGLYLALVYVYVMAVVL